MRGGAHRFAPAALLVLLAACAHVEAPPGGAEDREPPRLIATRPDSFAVVTDRGAPVVLVFDERISERGLETAVIVSPRTSAVRVDHRRDELRVSVREGWRPGLIYHVTVLPEVQDLFGNRVPNPVTFVFSTGPDIPATSVPGSVVDPIPGRPEVSARVEAIRRADSLVYALPSDSAGRFTFRHVPEGEYLVRAYRDMNRNRALEEFEPRDSAFVAVGVGDTAPVRLAILVPDTTPPRLTGVTLEGRVIQAEFDDHLDPEQTLSPASVHVLGADGSTVAVGAVTLGSQAAARRQPGGEVPLAPAPRRVSIEPAEGAELTPGVEYRVIIEAIRNIHGLESRAEGSFTAPAAPAADDPAGEVSGGGSDDTLPGYSAPASTYPNG